MTTVYPTDDDLAGEIEERIRLFYIDGWKDTTDRERKIREDAGKLCDLLEEASEHFILTDGSMLTREKLETKIEDLESTIAYLNVEAGEAEEKHDEEEVELQQTITERDATIYSLNEQLELVRRLIGPSNRIRRIKTRQTHHDEDND
jgi:FtsZ-binding cell division protein ZapB